MYIKPVLYSNADIGVFMHRYLPRLSDKILFNWAMIATLVANGGRVHLRASKNLREMLARGPRNEYLAQLATRQR